MIKTNSSRNRYSSLSFESYWRLLFFFVKNLVREGLNGISCIEYVTTRFFEVCFFSCQMLEQPSVCRVKFQGFKCWGQSTVSWEIFSNNLVTDLPVLKCSSYRLYTQDIFFKILIQQLFFYFILKMKTMLVIKWATHPPQVIYLHPVQLQKDPFI